MLMRIYPAPSFRFSTCPVGRIPPVILLAAAHRLTAMERARGRFVNIGRLRLQSADGGGGILAEHRTISKRPAPSQCQAEDDRQALKGPGYPSLRITRIQAAIQTALLGSV